MEGEVTKAPAKPEKKKLKMSSKVAPLVAAINEQAAQEKGVHLNEQEQLQRKNKKKAN